MHRKPLLNKLASYQATWKNEADTTKQFIDFVSSHADCFERTLAAGHVTGSAWVVNRAGTQVLLTHHKKLNNWFQLGGHADGNAHMLEVAIQEVKEESGLAQFEPVTEDIFDIDIHLIPERKNELAHYHYDVRFLIRSTGNDSYTVSDESHDLQWVQLNELAALTTEESMLRMAGKWKKLRGPPTA